MASGRMSFFGATARGAANHQGYTEIAALIGG
jgi:hypothetical protein